jgi:alpha-ketoglutarate-dependent taurine dioxygenase
MPFPQEAAVYESPRGLTITRLQPALGAEISGVDLRQPWKSDIIDDIRQALLDHGVIGFRNQDIDYKTLLAFGALWGDLFMEGPDPERPAVRPVHSAGGAKNQSANRWHSDSLHRDAPPIVSILRCFKAPVLGGDTAFCSAVAAYEGLSEALKAQIENMTFHSDYAYVHRKAFQKDGKALFSSVEKFREIQSKHPSTNHPVVRVHPETRARSLYLNEVYATYINGLSHLESAELMRRLCDEFKRPEYQCRWRWTDNAIVIWDNRAVLHYGVPDQTTDRILERVTAGGQKPISPSEWQGMQSPAAA